MADINKNSDFSNDIKVKVIGVGGAGSNIVDSLHFNFIEKVELSAINTDVQALENSPLNEKYKIGQHTTRGLSTGGEVELGRKAAEEDRELLAKVVANAELVFIVAGLGGGTGGGASPKLAEIAKEAGALVICFVSMPFTFEGPRKQQAAEASLSELRKNAHAVVPISNDLLIQETDDDASAMDAFSIANQWVSRGIGSIVSMLFKAGIINLDFAALKNTFGFKNSGRTLFGLGAAEGEDYVQMALKQLAKSPLLQTPNASKKADALLVNIYGGQDLSLAQVNQIVSFVSESFSSKGHVTVGAVIDETLNQALEVCVMGVTDMAIQMSAKESFELSDNIVIEKQTTLRKVRLERPAQSELQFLEHNEFRGYFEKTDRLEFEGEDLDVPTYLRRGIKIKL